MTSIYPRLVAPLQVKLAQFALLTHRAAVLAALPTGGKSRTHWATQPAPALLKAVVHYASQPGTTKVGQLLLKVWYQKKTELRTVVHRALYEAGYPVPTRAAAEPSPWTVRLTPTDIVRQENQLFFCPDGQRVPYAGDHLQLDQAVGQQLQLPARMVVGRRLAKQGHQMRLHPAIYLLVRARFTNFRLEHRHPFLAELAAHPLHRFGTAAQHGGQLGGRVPAGLLVAVEQDLNLEQLGRMAFVFLAPAF